MLDDLAYISEKDPKNALSIAASQSAQTSWVADVENLHLEEKKINTVVIAGMGSSGLAGGLIKNWLRVPIPLEIVKQYDLPAYVNDSTLVIVSSYSGNTEEALSTLEEAGSKGACIAITAAGGQLIDIAQERNYPLVRLPGHYPQRMALILDLRAIVKLLEIYKVIESKSHEIDMTANWLSEQTLNWLPEVPTEHNIAKQLAEKSAGKTAVIYSGSRMAPVGYKWKISFNENAKNLAFCNELPECNHNEFIGWTSHPIQKPFVIFDLISGIEHPQTLKRFEISDRLLSGMRPKSIPIELQGESVIAQMLWGCLLADFVSIYLAILNGVDPTQVDLIQKMKEELR